MDLWILDCNRMFRRAPQVPVSQVHCADPGRGLGDRCAGTGALGQAALLTSEEAGLVSMVAAQWR